MRQRLLTTNYLYAWKFLNVEKTEDELHRFR